MREKLKSKCTGSLFSIQATTFDTILDGSNLVGRACIGWGKTLAFVLPILKSLVNEPTKESGTVGYGWEPSVLEILMTRELARQVHEDFDV